MNKRTLGLKREALSELSAGELGAVVGGTHYQCAATDGCTHGQSFDVACPVPTNPIAPCLSLDRHTCQCIQTR